MREPFCFSSRAGSFRKANDVANFARPRRRINPELRTAVRASGKPVWILAVLCRFKHATKFSALINARSVPETAVNCERLNRIADEIGFDRERIFLNDGREARS